MIPRARFVVLLVAGVIAAAIAVPGGHEGASASFPGGNGLIAYTKFTSAHDSFNCDVYTVDPITREVAAVTDTPECEVAPAWSADGSRIAVGKRQDTPESSRLWVMNADGTGGHYLDTDIDVYDPAWSPDGTMIAFESSHNFGGLYVISADGGTPLLIAQPHGYNLDGGPSWSPDGTRIAYSENAGLALINPDGTNRELLGNGSSPSWSPDGRCIAFYAFVENGADLSIIDVSTREQANLGEASGHGEIPAWSPDGRQVAFVRSPGGDVDTQNIYAMNLDGTNFRQLTEHNQGALAGDWQPIPGSSEVAECDVSAIVTPTPTPSGVGGGDQQPTATPAGLPVTGGDEGSRGWDAAWLAVALVGVGVVAAMAFAWRRGVW